MNKRHLLFMVITAFLSCHPFFLVVIAEESEFKCGDYVENFDDISLEQDCDPHPGKAWCETHTDPCVEENECTAGDGFTCKNQDGQQTACRAAKYSTADPMGYCHPCDQVLHPSESEPEYDCKNGVETCTFCKCIICAMGTAYRNSNTCERNEPRDRCGMAYYFFSGCRPDDNDDEEDGDQDGGE